MLTLISSDGETFQVEEQVASLSSTIKHIAEERLSGGIPVPEVDGKTLSRVIEWCRKIAAGFENGEAKKSWELEFLEELNPQDLCNLVLASDFLDVRDLLGICCDSVAGLIRGKTSDQIFRVFGIQNRFYSRGRSTAS